MLQSITGFLGVGGATALITRGLGFAVTILIVIPFTVGWFQRVNEYFNSTGPPIENTFFVLLSGLFMFISLIGDIFAIFYEFFPVSVTFVFSLLFVQLYIWTIMIVWYFILRPVWAIFRG